MVMEEEDSMVVMVEEITVGMVEDSTVVMEGITVVMEEEEDSMVVMVEDITVGMVEDSTVVMGMAMVMVKKLLEQKANLAQEDFLRRRFLVIVCMHKLPQYTICVLGKGLKKIEKFSEKKCFLPVAFYDINLKVLKDLEM